MLLVLEAQFGESFTQTDFRRVVVFHRRVLLADNADELAAVHGFHVLTLIRLAEADGDNLGNVLLLHVLQVQFLNTRHLLVVEPVGRIQLTNLVEHLSIELVVVNVARIVDELPSLQILPFRSAR